MHFRVSVGLDWTRNSAHAALRLAKQRGFFAEAGLDVHFVSPLDAGAPPTPLEGLRDGSLDFGLCPCDQLLAAFAEPSSADLS